MGKNKFKVGQKVFVKVPKDTVGFSMLEKFNERVGVVKSAPNFGMYTVAVRGVGTESFFARELTRVVDSKVGPVSELTRFLRTKKGYDASYVALRFGVSRRTAQRCLASVAKLGFVRQVGVSKTGLSGRPSQLWTSL